MDLRDSINRFYYTMTVSDLRRLRKGHSGELSYNSIMYLDVIAYQSQEEGGCTISGLARTLGISKPGVTMKVKELESQGLVVRERSQGDRRVSHLRVSPRVEEELADWDRPLERAIRRAAQERTPVEIRSFCDILELLSQEFSAGEDENGKR
jgi:DNA-binding MarR family transcriptional regulator